MRLPDGAKSRALLIGTSAFDHLAPVPASRNNLRSLKDALIRHTGLSERHCVQLLNAPDLSAVGTAVQAAVNGAEDLLLVYYSGHGFIGPDNKLHLALPQTSGRTLPWSGVPFEFLHDAISNAVAATRVLVLDCCFSGVATEALSDEEQAILGQVRVTGTFTLTSSSANSVSYAPKGSDFTAFTGTLLELLEDGTPHAGELLTLNDIYLGLLRIANARGLPQPQKRGTHTADMLSLAPNRCRRTPSEVQRPQAAPPEETVTAPEYTAPQGTATALSVDEPVLTAAEVDEARFTTVRFVEGYDENEVDGLLERIALAFREPAAGPQRMRSADVRNSEFTITRMREGYDMSEVDAFLDRAELEFERRQAWAAAQDRP